VFFHVFTRYSYAVGAYGTMCLSSVCESWMYHSSRIGSCKSLTLDNLGGHYCNRNFIDCSASFLATAGLLVYFCHFITFFNIFILLTFSYLKTFIENFINNFKNYF